MEKQNDNFVDNFMDNFLGYAFQIKLKKLHQQLYRGIWNIYYLLRATAWELSWVESNTLKSFNNNLHKSLNNNLHNNLLAICLFHSRNLPQYLKKLFKSVSLRKSNLKLCTITSTKGTPQMYQKIIYLWLTV